MNYYSMNPMMDYQRNQLLAQQSLIQNQLNQMQYAPAQTQPQFIVRQVGNIEEAKGFPVDPCSTFLFVDTGSGRIYLKRLNTTNGKSDFYIYGVIEDKPEEGPFDRINERLANIERLIGGAYDKSVSSNGDNEESNGGDARAVAGKNEGSESTAFSEGSNDGKRKKRE